MTGHGGFAPQAPAAAAHRSELLAEMLLIRRFEEKCVELYSAGEIRGFVHLYIGEEAVAVGVNQALTPEDNIVSTYREHGHALVRGIPVDAVMAEMYGKTTGCSKGRGGSMHLFDARRRFYGGNAIVGGGLPLSIGLALADQMRGDQRITACFFGDGAVAEGEFHECLNLAALWDLPVLFCCENNRYAMGTALDREHAQTDLALRAASYGITAWPVDGMDVLSVDRYRDKTEVAQWRERDPIDVFTAQLREAGELSGDELASIEEKLATQIEESITAARAAPAEPVAGLTRFVYTPEPS